jgi:glycosyltransferase involved in cell wall biosynthesis
LAPPKSRSTSVEHSEKAEMGSPTGANQIKVVHLSSVHSADDIRIFWKECISLAEAGYDVTFIAADLGAFERAGSHHGVTIVTVQPQQGRLGRMILAGAAVMATGRRQDADVYHFHDPELIPGGLVLRLLGKRVIYDAHEDLPRNLATRAWLPRPLQYPATLAASLLEWFAARALTGVVAATPVIAQRFLKRRVALVQNFASLSEFATDGPPQHLRPYAVAYAGVLGESRCMFEMIDAMGKIERYPDARLIIAGVLSPGSHIDMLAASPGWRHVDFRGRQDRVGVRGILAEARVGLALYQPVQAHIDCLPTKVFEYMAAGLPVITANFPGFRRIVEDNGCGLCVPPCDVSAIAAAVEQIFADPVEADAMGRRGRELALRSFSWESEKTTLLRFYEQITQRFPRTPVGQGTDQDSTASDA